MDAVAAEVLVAHGPSRQRVEAGGQIAERRVLRLRHLAHDLDVAPVQRDELVEVAEVTHREIGGLAPGFVRRGCREQHRDDVATAGQGDHLGQVGAEVLGRHALGPGREVSRAQRESRLLQELRRAQNVESGQPRAAEAMDLLVLEAEPDPVVIPAVVQRDDARSQGQDVAPQLRQPLVRRPASHTELAARDGRAGVRRAQALEKQLGIRAVRAGAGVAHEEDLPPRPRHPSQHAVVGGGHPEEVRVGHEAVLEDHGIGIAELHPLGGEGEGEPDCPQEPLRQREGEQRPAC